MLRANDPWRPEVDERLVLEEVQVPPHLLDGVVHTEIAPAAFRAGEPATLTEVKVQVELVQGLIELDSLHIYGVCQLQGRCE